MPTLRPERRSASRDCWPRLTIATCSDALFGTTVQPSRASSRATEAEIWANSRLLASRGSTDSTAIGPRAIGWPRWKRVTEAPGTMSSVAQPATRVSAEMTARPDTNLFMAYLVLGLVLGDGDCIGCVTSLIAFCCIGQAGSLHGGGGAPCGAGDWRRRLYRQPRRACLARRRLAGRRPRQSVDRLRLGGAGGGRLRPGRHR